MLVAVVRLNDLELNGFRCAPGRGNSSNDRMLLRNGSSIARVTIVVGASDG